MKQAEKKKRDDITKHEDPFDDIQQADTQRKRSHKTIVGTHLPYHADEAGDAKSIILGNVRSIQYSSEQERAGHEQLRTFLGNLKWAKAEGDQCITWLKLYVFFRLNGGHAFNKRMSPIHNVVTVGNELCIFKKYIRTIKTFNVCCED